MRTEKKIIWEQRKNKAIAQVRAEALNDIRQIFHPKYNFPYNELDRDSSGTEQILYRIESIVDKLNRSENAIKAKFKMKKASNCILSEKQKEVIAFMKKGASLIVDDTGNYVLADKKFANNNNTINQLIIEGFIVRDPSAARTSYILTETGANAEF